MILWFDEMDKNSIADAGGKGANLGEMTRRGFSVPPGFCIVTEAYREHIRKLALEPYIELLSVSVLKEDMHALNEESAKVRQLIEETDMMEPAEQNIRKAYQKLTAHAATQMVSVRSSATAEDLPTASFAGLQETFLSVSGEEQLLSYVKKCWASLWTPRSIAYRQKNGFAHGQVALAVVIQAMVQSEKSGVLFTVNPVSGNTGEMMVNASYGLGESVVSGRVTPDTYILSKHDGRLTVEKHAGTKETQVITGPDGLTVVADVPEKMRSRFCLAKEDLHELRNLGMRVETHYGIPQDIEWAIAGKRLYLLQARPITAMPAAKAAIFEEKAANTRKLSKIQRKILDNFKEHIPDAPCPLDYETLIMLNEQKNAVFHELGITMPPERKMVLMDKKGVLSIGRMLPHPNIRLLWAPVTLRRLFKLDAAGSAKETKGRLLDEWVKLQAVDPSSLDNRALSDYISQAVDLAMKWVYLRFRAYVFPMVLSGIFLNRVIRRAQQLGPFVNQYDFLAGLNYKTVEIERALYRLAEQLDKSPAVRRLFLEKPSQEILPVIQSDPDCHVFYSEFAKFLKDYGARTMKAYTPFSAESWSERPELLLDTLTSILKAGNVWRHTEQQNNGEKKYADLKGKVISRLSKAKSKRFTRLLEQFRSAHSGREELVYRMEQCFVAARQGVAEASIRLCKNGLLSLPEESRYFTLSELKQVLEETSDSRTLCETAAERKAHRFMAEQAWNASSVEGEVGEGGTMLRGLSGSPGMFAGLVRIIHQPEEFGKLQKGEVLVCRFTDPVWTPLFSIAGAVVCDTGGPLSHAAIVAREYGIPAVLGVGNATGGLRDGDLVTVDGSRGTVVISRRTS